MEQNPSHFRRRKSLGPLPDMSERLNLVLCGSDGAVKSSISDLILGQREPSPGSSSVCVRREGAVCGRLVTLVEMPALYNTQLSEEEVMQESLRCVSLCDPGVHAFLLIIPEGRLTSEDKGELEKVQTLFGSRVKKHSLVIISADTQEDGTSELDEATRTLTEACRGGCYLFSLDSDVSGLIERVQQLLLENHGGLYTLLTYLDSQVEAQLGRYKNHVTEIKRIIQTLERKLHSPSEGRRQDALRIVLLGRTGTGKSATGNTILGKSQVFRQHLSPKSVTTVCQKERAEVSGRRITVIDTPGLFDTRVSNVDTQKEITRCIYMAAPGPHVFLLVLKVGQRFSEEEKQAVKIIQDIFGEESVAYTMVLFTGGDLLETMAIEEYLGEPGSEMMSLLEQCRNRYHVFNNKETRDPTQVTALLEKIDSMVAGNGGSCYTSEMFQQVEKEEQERRLKERLDQIEREKEGIIAKYKAENEKVRKALQEEIQNRDNDRKRREEEFNEREQRLKREMEEKEEQYRRAGVQRAEEYEQMRKSDEKRIAERERAVFSQMERQREEFGRQREEDQIQREQEEEKRREREEQERRELEEKRRKEREELESKIEELKRKVLNDERRVAEEERKQSDLEERIKLSEEEHVKELEELKHLQKELQIRVQEEVRAKEQLLEEHQEERERTRRRTEEERLEQEKERRRTEERYKEREHQLITRYGGEIEKMKRTHQEEIQSRENERRRREEELNERKERLRREKEEKQGKNTGLGAGGKSNDINNLLMRLQLTANKEQKLKPADALQITAQSLSCKETCTEQELVQTFLQRLLLGDYRARYTSVPEADSKLDHEGEDDTPSFADFISKKSAPPDGETSKDPVHPMDVQMAVFHCSDHFLKQLIVTKLSQCQYALPLLVPNPFTGEIEFPLWTFRQIKKSWKTIDTNDMKTIIRPICEAETPMVFFFRIGHISSSKSHLMSRLINEKHNTFFHRNCPGSSTDRLLMDGVVEIAWYFPSGKSTDRITDCVAFCNLHGDAENHEKQLEILTEMSSVNVVVVGDSTNAGILKKLYGGQKPLICLLCDDDSGACGTKRLKYKIGLKERNQAAVSEDLWKTIKECFSKSQNIAQPTFRLVNLCEKSGITTDENNPECRKGKEATMEIIQLLNAVELPCIKKTYLPCQGKLWHEWSTKNKELYRLHGTNIEMQSIEIKDNMKQIRAQQSKHGLTKLMELFIQRVNSCSPSEHCFNPIEKSFFLKWLEIMLDDFAADDLSVLHHEYNEKWSKVLDLKKQHNESKQLKDDSHAELEMISEKLKAANMGLEHILREMGQVYESFMTVQTNRKGNELELFTSLPKFAAELLSSGHPLELMDGDTSHVALDWVSAVLDELIQTLGDQRVFVLSVLGIQSSGKSTMLNAMFGLQFAVSAGRCTKGAFMQLVKVSEEMKEELKFDYILVVDTEGLRALELAGISTGHHDNELATFVLGLGNMTLINIFGENPAEMQDILQIVIQAFMRMKKVRLNPRCMFVHQNVSDLTAKEKNIEGRRHLQEKLDEMTQLAAKEETCSAEYFNDVIEFDIQNDVRYFAQLWEGSPPMAPPNPFYCENIQELKKTLLNVGPKFQALLLSQFKDRIKDLWTALMNENFVFSFRNTQEIAVYRKLEEQYGKWTWTLSSAMLRIQDKLHTRINNKQLHKVEYKLLVDEMQETFDGVRKSVKCYFEGERQVKDMMDQWRGRFEKKIEDLHEDITQQTKRELDGIIFQRDARKKLDEQRTQYEATLFEKSKELALDPKSQAKDETELRKQFDQVWSSWVSDLIKDRQTEEDINIKDDVFQVLSQLHGQQLVIEKSKNIHTKTTTNKYNAINTCGDYTKYVNLTKRFWEKYVMRQLSQEDNESIRQLILTVIQKAEDLSESKPVEKMGYKTTYIQEIAQLVKDQVAQHKSQSRNYNFKKEFTVDLSLHVCKRAGEMFAVHHKAFREATDPLIYLEKKKPEYYNVFQKSCHGATSVAVFGELICSELREPILQSVYNRTSSDLAETMKADIPAFNGNRSNLEKHILKSLAEEENFGNYMTYILDPQKHFKRFIRKEVKNYMKKENDRALSKIRHIIEHKQQCVISAAKAATEEATRENGDTSLWLKTFSDGLRDELEYNTEHLSANTSQDVNDFQLLAEVVEKEIPSITESLKQSISSLSDLRMEKFRKRPDDILIEHFCQCCWVQCPFCKAICTNTVENHDGDHSVPFHRNYGVNGWHYRRTGNLCINFCTTSVASDQSFYKSSDSDVLIPWKQYRTAGPPYENWSITPDLSELPYWKWFVCRFQEDLENHYKKKYQGSGQIPDQWRKYTKKDAIESLDKYI